MVTTRKFSWIEALLQGEILERTPRALWRHYPFDEYNSDRFVDAVVKVHHTYPFDLIKITPRSSFIIRDFGILDEFVENKLGIPTYLNQVVRNPEDWYKLNPLDPQKGYLKQYADCLERIVTQLKPTVPIVQTIFSPLSQAKNLCGLARLIDHWQNHREALMYGLEILAESTISFIKTINPWIDGIFYVIQECGVEELTQPSYVKICRHLDESILMTQTGQVNMLHLHGKILNFKDYCSYPVTFLHWDERLSNIPLSEGKRYFQGIVSGGVDWPIDGWSNLDQFRKACLDAIERIGRDRFLLSAGCVIPFNADPMELNEFCNLLV